MYSWLPTTRNLRVARVGSLGSIPPSYFQPLPGMPARLSVERLVLVGRPVPLAGGQEFMIPTEACWSEP